MRSRPLRWQIVGDAGAGHLLFACEATSCWLRVRLDSVWLGALVPPFAELHDNWTSMCGICSQLHGRFGLQMLVLRAQDHLLTLQAYQVALQASQRQWFTKHTWTGKNDVCIYCNKVVYHKMKPWEINSDDSSVFSEKNLVRAGGSQALERACTRDYCQHPIRRPLPPQVRLHELQATHKQISTSVARRRATCIVCITQSFS